MSAKTWLASLPSGEARTAASSITDPAFLRLFLDLLSRSDAEGECGFDTFVGNPHVV